MALYRICESLRLVKRLYRNIAHRHFGRNLFEFDANHAGLIAQGIWIIVNIHSHQPTVDDVDEYPSTCDDRVLIPVVDFNIPAEGITISDDSHDPWLLGGRRGDHLTSPGEHAK